MSRVFLKDISLNRGEYGIPASATTYIEGNYRYLRISDITEDGHLDDSDIKGVEGENLEQYLLKENDIVFARTGNSTGRAYFYEKKDGCLIYAGFLIKYSLDERVINPKYMKYFTISKEYKKWIQNTSVGSTRGGINAKTLLNLPITLPSRKQQDELVSVLSALDDQIELNNKINQELEDFAQTLYNYWFVQFEFPNEEGKPYKSSGGKMVWNEELKREIPEGWEVKNVLELVNWIGGTQPPKSEHIYEWREGYIRFIQNRDYQDNSHITYIKQTSTNKVCNEFDILMDKYGEAGKVRFGIAGAYNVALAKLEVINPDSREYIRSFFNDKNILEYLKNASIASTRASLNAQTLETIKVCYPTKDLLCKFETIAAQSIATILQNRQQNQELTQLRDYLLPLLMNGQVTVSDELFQE